MKYKPGDTPYFAFAYSRKVGVPGGSPLDGKRVVILNSQASRTNGDDMWYCVKHWNGEVTSVSEHYHLSDHNPFDPT